MLLLCRICVCFHDAHLMLNSNFRAAVISFTLVEHEFMCDVLDHWRKGPKVVRSDSAN